MAGKDQDTTLELSPRTTPFLIGHDAAIDMFLKCHGADRMHHAWLLAGPKGIGKATLAYHFARYLLKAGTEKAGGLLMDDTPVQPGPKALEMNPDDPVFTHVASGADGNLKVIERGLNEKTKRMRQQIIVDDVRALHEFFEKTAAHEGWRIAIIDSADEMNRNAANALLKMLEEPPVKSILFLVSHAKGRLVPTIRSRCQQLLLNPLSEEAVKDVLSRLLPDLEESQRNEFARVSAGSPGLAIRLARHGGFELYQTISALMDGTSMTTRQKHDFAGAVGALGKDEKYFLFLDILQAELTSRVKLDADNKSLVDCWLGLWEKVNRMQGEGEGLHLGRKQQILLLLETLDSLPKKPAAA